MRRRGSPPPAQRSGAVGRGRGMGSGVGGISSDVKISHQNLDRFKILMTDLRPLTSEPPTPAPSAPTLPAASLALAGGGCAAAQPHFESGSEEPVRPLDGEAQRLFSMGRTDHLDSVAARLSRHR